MNHPHERRLKEDSVSNCTSEIVPVHQLHNTSEQQKRGSPKKTHKTFLIKATTTLALAIYVYLVFTHGVKGRKRID